MYILVHLITSTFNHVRQTLKREHDGYRLEYERMDERKKILEKKLDEVSYIVIKLDVLVIYIHIFQMQDDISRKEQDFLVKAETWKVALSYVM